MTIRCPVCRADNATPQTCRRCRTDLSLLWSLEAERSRRLAECGRAVCCGNAEIMLREAARAESMRRGKDALLFLALGHLLQKEYVQTLTYLLRARNMCQSGPAG